MAKGSNDNSSAVKKVAKAAEAAGQRDLSVRSRLGFPALVGLICVLGIALVTFARLTREAEALPVQNRDHWHAVYGVWDCTSDTWAPPFQSTLDPEGIHSHQDGIIHIHPFFDASDGPDAKLRIWAEAMEIEISDEAVVLDNGQRLTSGTDCGEEGSGELHIRKWQFDFVVDSADPEIITEGLADINFLNDREVYVITNAPIDAEIPDPPSDRFDQLNAVAGAITSTGPVLATDEGLDFEVESPDGETDATETDADDTDTDDTDTSDTDTDDTESTDEDDS